MVCEATVFGRVCGGGGDFYHKRDAFPQISQKEATTRERQQYPSGREGSNPSTTRNDRLLFSFFFLVGAWVNRHEPVPHFPIVNVQHKSQTPITILTVYNAVCYLTSLLL